MTAMRVSGRRPTPSAPATRRPPGARPMSMRCRAATPASCWRSVSLRSRAVPVPGKELVAALETARIDSPRGAFTLSKAHNPIHDIYLRKWWGWRTGGRRRAQGASRSGPRLQARLRQTPGAPWVLPNNTNEYATFLIQLLNNVQYGLLLFFLASGLTLIFGS